MSDPDASLTSPCGAAARCGTWLTLALCLGCVGDESGVSPAAPATGKKQAAARAANESPAPAHLFVIDNESVERRLRDDASYLASDELEGRGINTEGLEKAARYIADSYARSGLRTDYCQGEPFHVFSTSSRLTLGESNKLVIRGPQESVELELGRSFTPLSLSRSGGIDLPLVFAGYGITAPDIGYDDYEGLDVAGKAVLILRREPRQADKQSPFNGDENSPHAYVSTKLKNAAAHGAAMVILCTDEFSLQQDANAADSLMSFRLRTRASGRSLPIVHTERRVWDGAFSDRELNLTDLERRIDGDLKPRSCLLEGWRVSGEVSVVRRGNQLKNVIGVLEGHGPLAAETIIVGAHYDHLGRGGYGSLAPWTADIHNGADDNASGSTVLLEVARQLAQRRERLRRRIMFITFSAEESGLIGSDRYARTPLVPLKDTIAMVNLDMVGRLRDNRLTVYGVGTATEFSPLLDRLGEQCKFRLRKISEGSGPSDHATFHARGVPVLHLFTGLHDDYHRPSDDVDKLNMKGMRRIAQMTTEIVWDLAQTEQRPKKRTRSSPATTTPLGPAILGTNVRASSEPRGCLITSLLQGSPAARSGLRVGDVLVRVADAPVVDRASLIKVLSARKPGDQVEIELLRSGARLGLSVTLAKREGR